MSAHSIQIRPILKIYRKQEGNSNEPHRGFGYVEFEDAEDTKDAIDNMDQADLFGKVIKVNAAKPPKNVNEGLGSKTALWEQVCYKKMIHGLVTNGIQEGWLAENVVSEEDKLAAERAKPSVEDRPDDPMQGLEGLDVAGPKPE